MAKGEKNSYRCSTCGKSIVTIDIDDGVTPMMLDCRATTGCQGIMRSGFYVAVDQSAKPDYEWFMPKSFKGYSREMVEHFKKGGLDLRKIRRTQDAVDEAKHHLTGRNGKPTNVCADGTLDPAPPVI